MKRYVKGCIAGSLALGGVSLASVDAGAAPALFMRPAVSASETDAPLIEKAYVVCGPFRCVRRGWGWRRPYYGWHRPWGWHRWGWRRW